MKIGVQLQEKRAAILATAAKYGELGSLVFPSRRDRPIKLKHLA